MAVLPQLGPVHHVRLTVSDVAKSRAFYTEVLGLEVAMDGPPPKDDPHYELTVENLQGGIVLTNGTMLLGLRPMDAGNLENRDSFTPFRAGLDHLSFSVGSREDLEAAAIALDKIGVSRGELADLPMFGIAVLPIQDPDGIQLELTAPL
ncbi:MAG: VOC family protein [Corynebacteriales bacterium]|nr:VOC family protein [Mycobacteriales bacterium]